MSNYLLLKDNAVLKGWPAKKMKIWPGDIFKFRSAEGEWTGVLLCEEGNSNFSFWVQGNGRLYNREMCYRVTPEILLKYFF